jgi:hypothetical protein
MKHQIHTKNLFEETFFYKPEGIWSIRPKGMQERVALILYHKQKQKGVVPKAFSGSFALSN